MTTAASLAMRRKARDGSEPQKLEIVRRNRRFELELSEGEAGEWHDDNPYLTHFWNGLSIMFPAGERFFIDSVRRFRGRIDDPQLVEDIRAFLSQEGVHTREHEAFNAALAKHGFPVAALESITRVSLWATRATSARWQLAITLAFEHFTATLADAVLRDPRILEEASPAVAELWRWHCVEEIEHKSVAFDVYEAIAPGTIGHLRRVLVMLIVTANYLPYIMFHQVVLAAFDRPIPDPSAILRAVRFLWSDPGLIRRGLGLYLSYFRPGFHPWEHDNSDLVRAWKASENSEAERR
jgi:predicted metal-dependent hydrolase